MVVYGEIDKKIKHTKNYQHFQKREKGIARKKSTIKL
jgi:hypothetical protein